jgi:hypothetical protein
MRGAESHRWNVEWRRWRKIRDEGDWKRPLVAGEEQRRGKDLDQRLPGDHHGDTIDGEWTDLIAAHEHGSSGHGTLKLKIIGKIGNGVDGLERIGASGAGFGGSKWSQPCNDTN